MNFLAPVAIGILVIVAIIAIAFNPSLSGVLFAVLVLFGAACIWYVRQVYLSQSERDD
jgi:hypothetical protein